MARKTPRTRVHASEILRDLFMTDFALSIHRLARDLRVPPTRLAAAPSRPTPRSA